MVALPEVSFRFLFVCLGVGICNCMFVYVQIQMYMCVHSCRGCSGCHSFFYFEAGSLAWPWSLLIKQAGFLLSPGNLSVSAAPELGLHCHACGVQRSDSSLHSHKASTLPIVISTPQIHAKFLEPQFTPTYLDSKNNLHSHGHATDNSPLLSPVLITETGYESGGSLCLVSLVRDSQLMSQISHFSPHSTVVSLHFRTTVWASVKTLTDKSLCHQDFVVIP